MALGEELKKAREALKISITDVASGTRMMASTVEAIEHEDFRKIPASIYAKGFIKLYAEYVGLDPHPLIQEFSDRFGPVRSAPVSREPAAESPAVAKPEEAIQPARDKGQKTERDEQPDLFTAAEKKAEQIGDVEPEGLGTRFRRMSAEAGRLLRRAGRSIVRQWNDLRRTGAQRLGELRSISISETPVKVASVVIGVIIVLIFVVSSLSRCSATRQKALLSTEGESRRVQQAAEQPSEPYFDTYGPK